MSNNSFLWLANWQSQGEVDCIGLLSQYQPKNKFGLFIKLFIFAYFFPGEKCKQTEFSRSVMHETEACLVPILITRQTCASSFQACWPVIPVNLQRFCVISLGESLCI